ncbi:MAG: permease-like cell division protein FtsX, partial [Pseudonocardiaceae bacterium]
MRASFVFSEVATGLRRNVTMTVAMILTTAISLGLLGGGLLVVRTIDQMQQDYYQRVETVVYLRAFFCFNDPTCM